jgi:hypothetical protein
MNGYDKVKKGNGLVIALDILSEDQKSKISKALAKSSAESDKFINLREEYASLNWFAYYEIKYIDKNKIVLEYDKKKYELPWQCNQDIQIFKLVVDELAATLKTEKSKSPLPKPDLT